LAASVTDLAKRLEALEKQVRRCRVCGDREVVRVFSEDDDGTMRLVNPGEPCASCGSPNTIDVYINNDDEGFESPH
jgi:hypothetical protein